MSELVEIVDSLENKVSRLLHKLEVLNKANTKLKNQMAELEQQHKVATSTITEWEERYESLKMASSMLGGNTNKTEAKLKINTLIRELDQCIAHLAE